MSEEPDNVLDLGQELQFLPAWAQEDSKSNKYSQYEGARERRPQGRGGPRRRDDSGGARRDDRRGQRRPARDKPSGGKGPRRESEGRDERRPPKDRRERPTQDSREREPLLELKVAVVPAEKGVESIAKEIKHTGRAFPLFQIAQLILDRPERYSFEISVKKAQGGKPLQRLFACTIDQTLWLSREAVARHALKDHFGEIFETRRTETEAPKGNHTFVAQCGISGVLLGPPNHHAYQDQVARLYAERFSRMPFDEYKSRIRIVHDSETVSKWVEQASWKTEFATLGEGETQVFGSRADAETHFREHDLGDVCDEVDGFNVPGPVAKSLIEPRRLATLLRVTWQKQRRFPLDTATKLSRQFGGLGLQFFKRDRTVTHVSVARPSYLNIGTTAVSESIRKLVEFIESTPECTRRKILEALAESPTDAEEDADQSPEKTQLVSNLHWLIHQGHVIEFSNGFVETAKPPRSRKQDEVSEPENAEEAEPEPSEKDPAEAKAKPVDNATPEEEK